MVVLLVTVDRRCLTAKMRITGRDMVSSLVDRSGKGSDAARLEEH